MVGGRQSGGPSGLAASPAHDHAGDVTTRIGFLIIAAGIVLLVLRAINLVDTEAADIASTLAIVVGAVAVAIDGEVADRGTT